jgi:hypothetical protein
MAFNFFGFGRTRRYKRRSVRKTGKKASPSKTLIRLCKKYKVKVTSGRSRKYKSTRVLKKQCAKKIRSLIKKAKRSARFGARRSRFGLKKSIRRMPTRSSSMRSSQMMMPMAASSPSMMSRFKLAARRAGSAAYRHKGKIALTLAALAAAKRYGGAEIRHRRRGEAFKNARMTASADYASIKSGASSGYNRAKGMFAKKEAAAAAAFGRRRRYRSTKRRSTRRVGRPRKYRSTKRRSTRRVGRPRKYRSTKRRTTRRTRRRVGRRYRFGSGNPPLGSSMGYEFCSGGGGVLGANSTGLFPSPCMGGSSAGGAQPIDQNVMAAFKAANAMYAPAASKFGKRRRRM